MNKSKIKNKNKQIMWISKRKSKWIDK
jgi:hypothetical protein